MFIQEKKPKKSDRYLPVKDGFGSIFLCTAESFLTVLALTMESK